MDAVSLQAKITRAIRSSLLSLLRAHPDWKLEQLMGYIEGGGSCCEQLGSLTVAELVDPTLIPQLEPTPTGELVDVDRLRRAEQVVGEAFEGIVSVVLAGARRPVKADYLRERVGGPRWKVTKALHRLEAQGLVERQGRTSGTSWRYKYPDRVA